jgi:hypothetical protein
MLKLPSNNTTVKWVITSDQHPQGMEVLVLGQIYGQIQKSKRYTKGSGTNLRTLLVFSIRKKQMHSYVRQGW